MLLKATPSSTVLIFVAQAIGSVFGMPIILATWLFYPGIWTVDISGAST